LDVVHELLVLGSDFLKLAPIPGLSPAARSLVEIWDAGQTVNVSFSWNALSYRSSDMF